MIAKLLPNSNKPSSLPKGKRAWFILQSVIKFNESALVAHIGAER